MLPSGRLCFALLFVALFLVHASLALVDEADIAEDALWPSPLVVSRHLQGRWSSTWTSACTRRQTIGSLFFENQTSQFFAWREEGGQKFDFSIVGEGTSLPYLPFLQNVPRPKSNDAIRLTYGYQLCTEGINRVATGGDSNRWGPVTETRVMRGFIFEVDATFPDAAFVLDRCVDGLNRNYNFYVTTMGAPISSDDVAAGELTRNVRMVRWQFRLPGNIKCDPALQPTEVADDGRYDRAADNAFDVMVWTRTELPERSFWDHHFNMIVFAVLFIFFRIFVSFRFNSEKLKNQRDLFRGVAEEVAENKKAVVAAVKNNTNSKAKAVTKK